MKRANVMKENGSERSAAHPGEGLVSGDSRLEDFCPPIAIMASPHEEEKVDSSPELASSQFSLAKAVVTPAAPIALVYDAKLTPTLVDILLSCREELNLDRSFPRAIGALQGSTWLVGILLAIADSYSKVTGLDMRARLLRDKPFVSTAKALLDLTFSKGGLKLNVEPVTTIGTSEWNDFVRELDTLFPSERKIPQIKLAASIRTFATAVRTWARLPR